MMQAGLHCFVSGRVQGVFYRASTQREAIKLGLTGWVRNLADGRVEVLAFGNQDQLDNLLEWLWQGPSAAAVTAVDHEKIIWQQHKEFIVC